MSLKAVLFILVTHTDMPGDVVFVFHAPGPGHHGQLLKYPGLELSCDVKAGYG